MYRNNPVCAIYVCEIFSRTPITNKFSIFLLLMNESGSKSYNLMSVFDIIIIRFNRQTHSGSERVKESGLMEKLVRIVWDGREETFVSK